jgi:hypothetical protein
MGCCSCNKELYWHIHNANATYVLHRIFVYSSLDSNETVIHIQTAKVNNQPIHLNFLTTLKKGATAQASMVTADAPIICAQVRGRLGGEVSC